jgi:hypothetical protein
MKRSGPQWKDGAPRIVPIRARVTIEVAQALKDHKINAGDALRAYVQTLLDDLTKNQNGETIQVHADT